VSLKQKISASLWLDNEAEEAAKFYVAKDGQKSFRQGK